MSAEVITFQAEKCNCLFARAVVVVLAAVHCNTSIAVDVVFYITARAYQSR
jgi:hypothetical protein